MQPDLFFVAHDQDGIVKERVYGAPELVIEVLSPNPRVGSIDERIGWFARFGVRECWLVDAEEIEPSVLRFLNQRIAERVRLRRDQPIQSAAIPEFTATLEEIVLNEGHSFPLRRV